jgi:hypothetical protein
LVSLDASVVEPESAQREGGVKKPTPLAVTEERANDDALAAPPRSRRGGGGVRCGCPSPRDAPADERRRDLLLRKCLVVNQTQS